MPMKLPSKLKIGGGLLALVILASLYARGEFWKGKHAKAEAALVDMQVKEGVYKRKITELKTLAMTPKEIEEKIKVVYIEKGSTANVTGYIASKKQVAICKACLDGQIENDETVGKALGARNKAILLKDLAIHSKKKWKGVAVIGIPLGILGGFAIAAAL